jgi:hypothetical protein
MTAGDIAIYRNASDSTTSMSPTSWTDLAFDTTVREDTDTYDMQISNKDIELKEAGHYLVMFSELATCNYLRYSISCRIVVGGSSVAIIGRGYSRASEGCNDLYMAGAGIIDVDSAGTDLNVQVQENTGTSQTATRDAGVAGVQLLKLNDDWDYFRAESDTASAVLALGDEILWENVIEEDSGSFELQANDYDIQVEAGYYLCCYTVPFACTTLGTTGRVGAVAYLLLDGTEVEGSRSMGYGRSSNGCSAGCVSCICIFEADSTQNLKLKTTVSNRTGGGQIIDDSTSIQIVKLPDDTLKKCWVYDGTGGYDIITNLTDLNLDDELDVDTDVFTHSTSTNTDEIQVDEDGDYLFMYGLYEGENGNPQTPSTTNKRYTQIVRWKDSTQMSYGAAGSYYRGYANGRSYIQNTGSSHGILFDSLTSGDVIELTGQRESTNTDYPPLTVTDKSAVSAIQLSSIFPEDDEDVTGSYWYAQQGF